LTYSMMHQSVVTAPDNIAMLPDRIARQYNGGANNRFYTDPSEFSQIITERPDIIAMIVPMDHKFQRREPTGGIDLDGLYGPKGSSRFPDARYYENIWHLSEQATRTENMRHGHEDASQAIPNYSWLGESLNWNKERRCRAAGHRRGGSHPGCLDVWNGNKSIFPDPPPIPEEWAYKKTALSHKPRHAPLLSAYPIPLHF